jgi:sugar fermentation stimulation protein A
VKLVGKAVGHPLECTIIQRLNRFVVEIKMDDSLHHACINNTGRLKDCLFYGNRGFCTMNVRPLKTSYRLFAIREGDLAAIIDTRLQMKAFEEAFAKGLMPRFHGCTILKRNVRLGNSIIDYLLGCSERRVYLEVKSAVLREGRYAMYPDCPSARGRRHVRELIHRQMAGEAAAVLFIAALPDVEASRPSWAADPDLCDLLIEARDTGVAITAVALLYNPGDCSVYLYHSDLPIEL